ncbi:MAG TPA: PAS domain S-box protein [Terriglobales bacterium]|nr:PAS domain S-box protein [Terriglobales bacterium]
MTRSSAVRMMNPPAQVLFGSDLWKPALEKYAKATHVTVKLFDTNLRVVFGPIHPTPLFELFDGGGYDPGLFAECARQCLAQTTDRPAITVSKVHGLAVVGTSLVLDGEIVGAAVVGYVLVDFSQLSEIQRVAKDAHLDFAKVWQVAREQSPVSQQRLTVNGELLQVLGDALLRENSRTRQYENTALKLEESGRAKESEHNRLLQTASVLRESEERYRTLFDLGPIAVYSCDASGVIRDYNHVAAELWGREPKPDADERWCGSLKMLRPDGTVMPHGECPMADVVSGRVAEVHDGEVQIERTDGSRVTVLVNIRPLKDARGVIIGAINCFVDITERKQIEMLTASLAAIVTSSDDAIISKDLNGVILSWNAGAERLFGYTAQEAIGRPVTILIPPERFDEEPRILQSIRSGQPIEHYETVRRRKDGKLLDVSLSVSPIRDGNGRIVGASKIARDITQLKETEKRLRESNSRLETRVKERTSELEGRNAEILAQSDQLQELSTRLMKAQDDERRKISRELHDSLGQYLAYAKMCLEASQKPGADENESHNIQQLSETLDRCVIETRTISHLLHPPLLDEIGFSSAARWYIESFSERSGIHANVNIPEDLPQRLPAALELALFRILQESLVNVHRHSQSKSVDIHLELNANEVILEIIDHGEGMPPESLERFRAKDKLGSGVGLRSMSGRIRELGGSFEIESDKEGTLIRVAAPIPVSSAKIA